MGDSDHDKHVYICECNTDLSSIVKDCSYNAGNVIDVLINRFPQLDQAQLEGSDSGKKGANLILGANRFRLEFFIYAFNNPDNKGCLINQNRGCQKELFRDLLGQGYTWVRGFKAKYPCLLVPEGDLIVLVNSSVLSRSGQPTVSQYENIVQDCCVGSVVYSILRSTNQRF